MLANTDDVVIDIDGITHQYDASISCDLHWFGACDYDLLTKKPPINGVDTPRYEGRELFYVPVKSGLWQMTQCDEMTRLKRIAR